MKNIFPVLLCFVFVNTVFPSVHYYYKGNRIELKQRNDKVIIVANELNQSKAYIQNELNKLLDAGDELKNPYGNVFEIILKEESSSKIQNYTNRLSSKSNIIKFTAPAYYFDTYTTTIICADEFILKLKNKSDKTKLDNLNIQNGAMITESFPDGKLFALKTFNGNSITSLEISEIYFSTGLFEYCEPNFIYPDNCLLTYTPNDANYPVQWNLRNNGQIITANTANNGVDPLTYIPLAGADMKVNLAWDYTKGNPDLEIGVMDTGIDSTHPDLKANLFAGYDALWNVNSVPFDSGKHGTAVAGIIAATGDNTIGVAGIAYQCKLRSYRIFNSAGSTATIWILRGYQKAIANNAALLNNSWAGTNPSSTITEIIDSCAAYGNNGKGCVILFGSGNNGANPVLYPSYLSSVICVGASTAYDQKKAPGTGMQYSWGGNYGSSENGDIDLVAPTIVPTTDIQGTGGYNTKTGVFGDYDLRFNGTSCACPNATGVAALIYSVNTNQTASQVKSALLRGCDKIDNAAYNTTKTYGQWNEYTGYGRANAYNSVRLAAGADVIPPSLNHENIEPHNSTYPTIITAGITDLGGEVDINSPKVIYRMNKNNSGWSAFDTASYSSEAGNVFTFKIPAAGWETQVQYYITAKDNNNNTAYFPLHAPDTTNLCYFAIGNIQSVTQKISGPTNINSLVGVSSATTTFPSFTIIKTKVRLYIRHARVSDLNASLFSPVTNAALNIKNIFSQNSSGATTGIINGVAMDSAASFWKSGTQPYTGGVYKPDYFFNGLNGLNAEGSWKILMYDGVSGTGGTFDSAFVTLYKTSGESSPAVVLNTPADSIATFNGGSSDTVDFYLKNNGTGELAISGASFSGEYAVNFSLLSSVPSVISANDSGLFRILCNQGSLKPKSKNIIYTDNTDDFENATLDISTNDPSKPVVKISLQALSPLPVELINFTSSVERNNVKLNWTTAFEINNAGFDIERKLTDENSWVKSGSVRGRGTTNNQQDYSFEEGNLLTGKYNFRLMQIDINGSYKYYELPNEVYIGIPSHFAMSQNYPNPFNPSTNISYQLAENSFVTIKIFDMSGREMYQLVNESKSAGYYTMKFTSSNLASGIYFYMINAASDKKSFIRTMKMVLVK